ncbi:response regulator/GGDEF domain-containing protein [Sphaerotilus natans subsp. natans DSM 6575]|uniref:diguanylate cyclase n=1 Tax=Sphaerotilus natans subsp. natans DSM 6575 TaxID=1286631 RepID=A0A059KJF8_9BURK|nr:GGDEF domain-containing protein [Sphaerotilus natans]KDB51253.1 response regulator/GGDEF domain-containing protein [Sphaerotilus natans subsp. natans DSM 6575]SIQ89324.1 diguanylate cyclase (GGDEF) domain-containing protein [Sphaerotilus natans]
MNDPQAHPANPAHPATAGEPVEAAPRLPTGFGPWMDRLADWVHRIGVRQATLAIVGSSVLLSVLLDVLWHWLAGWPLSTRSLLLATLLPVPIAGLGAGITLRLIVALDQARSRAEQLALTDALTGVRNRRWFMTQAALEFERATRHGRSLALVLIDVDHFKRVNDEHGHQTGDRLLVEIAQTCAATLRRTDLLARFGGEEFIVLLPETGQREAVRLAERMRQAVQAGLRDPQHPLQVPVTISLGVVAMSAATPTLDALIRATDQALYDAKRAGRDRVHTLPLSLGG